MFAHLRARDFIDRLEGVPLSDARWRHLSACDPCRERMGAIERMEVEVRDIDEESLPDVDWSEFRASVRNELLARAVRRSSAWPAWRWTGPVPRPAAFWSTAFVLLFAATALWGLWHFNTQHPPSAVPAATIGGTGIATATSPGGVYLEEPDSLEAQVMAWSQAEIFTALSQLEESEEEALRALIASAESDLPVGEPVR